MLVTVIAPTHPGRIHDAEAQRQPDVTSQAIRWSALSQPATLWSSHGEIRALYQALLEQRQLKHSCFTLSNPTNPQLATAPCSSSQAAPTQAHFTSRPSAACSLQDQLLTVLFSAFKWRPHTRAQ